MRRFIPNSTMLPNAFFDEVMQHLSEKALRAYLIIARKTTGWGKELDSISIAQFKQFTGIKDDRTIRSGLDELIGFGLIRSVDNPGYPTKFALVNDADFSKLVDYPLHGMQGDPLHGMQGDPLHEMQGDPLHGMHPTKTNNKTTNKNKKTTPNGVVQKNHETKLGNRFDLDILPDIWRQFCHDERPGLNADIVFARFRDYWIAQPGAKGRKLDWFATWRNWVRNENLRSDSGSHRQSGQHRKLSLAERAQQDIERLEARERRDQQRKERVVN